MTSRDVSSDQSSDDEETCLLEQQVQTVVSATEVEADSYYEYGTVSEKYKILFVIGVCAFMLIVVLILYPSKSWSDDIFAGSDVTDFDAGLQNGVGVKRPNIIFITASGLGWNDVGWRNWEVRSPNLNKLAEAGGVFNWSYAHSRGTLTQAAILSGVYAHKHYVGNHDCSAWNFTILPQLLKEAGYATHMVGMWKIGYCDSSNLPTNRGFDSFFGSLGNAVDYYTHMTRNLFRNLFQNLAPAPGYQGIFSTSLFADKSVETIQQHESTVGRSNLFLFVSFHAISQPTDPPQEYRMPQSHPDVWSRRLKVYEMINALDDGVGKIVAALKQTGMSDNTILVFSSDSGGAVDEASSNSPLRGGKFMLWEGGTRITTVLRYSKIQKENIKNLGLFHATDWLPTLLAAAGVASENVTKNIDGLNQWPLLTAKTARPEVRSRFIAADHKQTRVIRYGRYKLILGDPVKRSYKHKIMEQLNTTEVNLNCCFTATKFFADEMCADFNLVPLKETFLFDVSHDPTERNNLARLKPRLVQQLTRLLLDEQRSSG